MLQSFFRSINYNKINSLYKEKNKIIKSKTSFGISNYVRDYEEKFSIKNYSLRIYFISLNVNEEQHKKLFEIENSVIDVYLDSYIYNELFSKEKLREIFQKYYFNIDDALYYFCNTYYYLEDVYHFILSKNLTIKEWNNLSLSRKLTIAEISENCKYYKNVYDFLEKARYSHDIDKYIMLLNKNYDLHKLTVLIFNTEYTDFSLSNNFVLDKLDMFDEEYIKNIGIEYIDKNVRNYSAKVLCMKRFVKDLKEKNDYTKVLNLFLLPRSECKLYSTSFIKEHFLTDDTNIDKLTVNDLRKKRIGFISKDKRIFIKVIKHKHCNPYMVKMFREYSANILFRKMLDFDFINEVISFGFWENKNILKNTSYFVPIIFIKYTDGTTMTEFSKSIPNSDYETKDLLINSFIDYSIELIENCAEKHITMYDYSPRNIIIEHDKNNKKIKFTSIDVEHFSINEYVDIENINFDLFRKTYVKLIDEIPLLSEERKVINPWYNPYMDEFNTNYSLDVDIWSFGIILYNTFFKKNPLFGCSNLESVNNSILKTTENNTSFASKLFFTLNNKSNNPHIKNIVKTLIFCFNRDYPARKIKYIN